MKSLTTRKTLQGLLCGVCLSAAAASQAANTALYFRAAPSTNTMPDGRKVIMWGFAQEGSAASVTGVVQVPGPAIKLGPGGNQNLSIHLRNQLPEPVSIVIPGQIAAPGAPQRNADGRARSFTAEAAPGGSATFAWANLAEGTYLYHSGSHPAVQVQMGLYGALTYAQSANRAYQSVNRNLDGQIQALFSEIDPDLHDAVANGSYGPAGTVKSTLHYRPQYFMINGVCYTPGVETDALKHLAAATIPANGAARTVLVRLLNAGIDYHVPVLGGFHLEGIAEDGKPYPYARTLSAPTVAPLKTLDALWTTSIAGTFPIYDRRLATVNGASAGGLGGMVGYVGVGKASAASAALTWRAVGAAIPYPSAITVSGLDGVVSKVTVTINNLRHQRPSDLDVLLVSPDNKAVLLMSDVGGGVSTLSTPVTLTFDDSAAASLSTAALASGAYKPTDLAGAPDTFNAGPPAGPYGASLAALSGAQANGSWRLFVMDNAAGPGNTPTASGGTWSLTITPRPAP